MTKEEAIDFLKEEKFKNVYSLYRNKVIKYRIDWNDASDMAIEALEADTVEVVRCKDCKHYKPFDKSKKFDCPQGLYAVFENDYCSHGERSE